MSPHVKMAAEECTRRSDDGSLAFPEQIEKLAGAGVESYFADLRRSIRIYYLPSGESVATAAHDVGGTVAERFDAAAVVSAIRQSQAGTHTYREFCQKAKAAGCAGYLVTLLGRRVLYFGRTGETHTEHFPIAS